MCSLCDIEFYNDPIRVGAMKGFGIPVLHVMVRERMGVGASLENAIADVADYAELRSEAIDVLRASFPTKDAL